MGKTAALILAAGKSTRMQADVPKQFMEVLGKPLFMHSVLTYLPLVDQVVLVTNKEAVEEVRETLRSFLPDTLIPVVEGGEERYDSSWNGIKYLEKTGGYDLVMIHDAARAFVTKEVIQRAMDEAKASGTAVAAVPSKDTIKIARKDGTVIDTPDRRTLYAVQTPQAFSLSLILEAFRRFFEEKERNPELEVTDDASLVERFTDHPVRLVRGDYGNLKITTPEDLKGL